MGEVVILKDILGEAKPLFAIRKFSATELTRERTQAFAQFPRLQGEVAAELEEAEATQNFLNGTQNYPLLKGMSATPGTTSRGALSLPTAKASSASACPAEAAAPHPNAASSPLTARCAKVTSAGKTSTKTTNGSSPTVPSSPNG